MARFWDARAREDAFFFVDNRLRYGAPDLEWLWAEGLRDLDRVLDLTGMRVGGEETVLDLGCGVGRLTRGLAARARRVVALDVSNEMLERARTLNAHLANVEWVLGDGTDLAPLADDSLDGCVSHVVFQHISDPNVTLGYVRELGRVLRRGGWAALQLSTDPTVHRPRTGVAHRLRELVGRAPRGQRDPAWLGSAVDFGALERTAAEAGLALERVAGAGTQHTLVGVRRAR